MTKPDRRFGKDLQGTLSFIPVIILILIISAECLFAQPREIHHNLWIELIPEEQKLKGVDHIRVVLENSDFLRLHLSEKALIKSVLINNRNISAKFDRGFLQVPVIKTTDNTMNILIKYEVIFDDPVPYLPVNTDNPGFGVTGTLSEKGVFLLSGSGWRPVVPDHHFSCSLTVKAPKGMIAVTAGKRLGESTEGNHTISRWEIQEPVRGLSLSAGYYQVFEKSMDRISLYAFLFPESAFLAKDYLEATARYIRMYESMFGPYPFPKFAVVENFFPTGYGFASYTLLGSQVLRLPFIIDTSLGHEIAHSWWGNGVYPDFSMGNWSEGLTTYVADHLFKEHRQEEEARSYRLQMLRNYATLVNPSNDFPLRNFISRMDPVTKVIGYDKAAMVFHMLRKEVGEKNFWISLQKIYDRYLFQKASWNEFRNMFEEISGRSLQPFFDQWINRMGAPQLMLKDIEFIQSVNGGRIKGKLVQKPPFYDLRVILLLETDRESQTQTISFQEESTLFEFDTENTPVKLYADPNVDIFRKMASYEIPPTINSLKASNSMAVVLADSMNHQGNRIADLLMEGLGIKTYQIIHEKDLQHSEKIQHDILWIGMPSKAEFFKSIPETVSFTPDGFWINQVEYDKQEDVFFGVFPNPDSPEHVLGFFYPHSNQNLEVVVRKVSHYGKYSYLAFREGHNLAKGEWTVDQSPLIYHFDTRKGAR